MPIDLTSPTRLADATRPLVDPEAVSAQLRELGEAPGPVTEGRWLWNAAGRGTTDAGGYHAKPPREWEALVDFLGITVTRDGDRIEFTGPARG